MNEYIKTLKIETVVDEKAYLKFKKDFKETQLSSQLLNKKDGDTLASNYAKVQLKMEKIKKLKEAIADIQLYGGKDSKKALKELNKQLKEAEKVSFSSKLEKSFSKDGVIGKKILDIFSKAGEIVADYIKNSFSDAIQELKTMAGYNYATSIFGNQSQLQTSLQYGLSGSNSYALNKALEFFEYSSIEDLAYKGPEAQKIFAEKIGYYVDKYNSLNNSGFFEKWEQFRFDFKTFKENTMYEIMQWIMDNKDTLVKGFNLLTSLMETTVQILAKIADSLRISRSQSQIDAKTSDIISNYSNVSKNNNLTVNNTFNGVQASNQQQLVNAGELTYAQMKKAIYSY